jgi:hypothetical protein
VVGGLSELTPRLGAEEAAAPPGEELPIYELPWIGEATCFAFSTFFDSSSIVLSIVKS